MNSAVPRREGNRIIIHEVPRSQWWTRLGMGLLGLAILASALGLGIQERLLHSPWLMAAAVVAVLSFGIGALLASRQRGQFEIIELSRGELFLRLSESRLPAFEAPIGRARFQRVKHPMGLRLVLRDTDRAVEVGRRLPPSRRATLAELVETALGEHNG